MVPHSTWSLLLLLAPLTLSAPSPQTLTPAPADPPAVHVNNMTTYGTGCPIGGGPIAQATKDGRPIFAFTEWGLALPDAETPGGSIEKWCSEEIDLAGPKKSVVIGAEALSGDNAFEVVLVTEPTDVWSECVPASGVVPHLSMRVTAGLVGVDAGGGVFSTGTLGGESRDLKKALKVRFTPVWQACASTGEMVPST